MGAKNNLIPPPPRLVRTKNSNGIKRDCTLRFFTERRLGDESRASVSGVSRSFTSLRRVRRLVDGGIFHFYYPCLTPPFPFPNGNVGQEKVQFHNRNTTSLLAFQENRQQNRRLARQEGQGKRAAGQYVTYIRSLIRRFRGEEELRSRTSEPGGAQDARGRGSMSCHSMERKLSGSGNHQNKNKINKPTMARTSKIHCTSQLAL